MKLTEEQKLGLKSLGFKLNDSHIAIYKSDFKDKEAFNIIAENLNIKDATNITFAIVGFKGGYKKSELNEKSSLLEWENKNLKSFLKFKGYTEEQIIRVSLLRGKK